MKNVLLERSTKIRIRVIGVFYVITGIWEYFHFLQGDSINYYLLDLYRNYVVLLGCFTVITGFGLLFNNNFFRLCAILLAWWNIFTVPILDVWWPVYSILIKKFLVINSWLMLWFWTGVIILATVLIRIYIIYMLRINKAGYILLSHRYSLSDGNGNPGDTSLNE